MIDIFDAAGLKKPDISILSDEFLAEVQVPPGATSDEPADAVRDFDAAMEELFAADPRVLPVDASTHSRDDIYFDHD